MIDDKLTQTVNDFALSLHSNDKVRLSSFFARYFNRPAHLLNHISANAQTEAQAGVVNIIRVIELPEIDEQVLLILFRNAVAVISDD